MTNIASEPRSLRHNRDYLLLWSGQTVSAIGSQFTGFIIPLLVLALTNSPAQAGLVGALQGVPYIVLSLPAGALVDRWNRKMVMIICDSGRAVNVLTVPVALAIGHLSMAQLYVVALVEGTLFVFFNVAEVASLVRVVGPDQLPGAIARQETTWGISALIGPAAAGALYQAVSAALPFLVDACSYLVSALSLSRIRTQFQADRSVPAGTLRSEMHDALLWLWRQPLLRFVALVTAVGDFLFSGIGLIPLVIARQQMHASPVTIGLIFTLAAIGGILGSSVAGWVQRRVTFGPALIAAEWMLALLYPLLAIAPNPVALGLVRTAMSGTVSVSNTVRLSYQLGCIPDALQGRVNSLTTLLAYGSLPIGEALTGVLLQSIGPTHTIMAITIGLAASAAAVTLNPHVRHAPGLHEDA